MLFTGDVKTAVRAPLQQSMDTAFFPLARECAAVSRKLYGVSARPVAKAICAGNSFLRERSEFYDVHTSQFLSSYVIPRLYISFYRPAAVVATTTNGERGRGVGREFCARGCGGRIRGWLAGRTGVTTAYRVSRWLIQGMSPFVRSELLSARTLLIHLS